MTGADYDALGEAKRLLRVIRSGGLGTLNEDGAPFTSLTAVATMPDGSPILLLSTLAAHTRHLERDGRCSLLLVESGKGDPLAHPRLTLVGSASRAGPTTDAAATRFLSRNPKSKLYAGFPDFSFWIVKVEAAHLNGGFARAASFGSDRILTDIGQADSLLESEEGAVEHMNSDHAEAVRLYATRIAGLPDGAWRLSGVDPEGMDLVCGDLTGRVPFTTRVTSPTVLRETLVQLAAQARQQIA